MKKTGWYSGLVKPVRRGWFEVRCEHDFYDKGVRLYWDSNYWYFDTLGRHPSTFGNVCDQWRGLKEKQVGY